MYPSAANAQQSPRHRKLSLDVPAITQENAGQASRGIPVTAFLFFKDTNPECPMSRSVWQNKHEWQDRLSPRPASPWLSLPKPRACWTIHNKTSNDHIFDCYIMAMNTKTYGSDSLKYFQQVSLVVKWEFTTSWEPILPPQEYVTFFCFVLNLYRHINLLRNPLYSLL